MMQGEDPVMVLPCSLRERECWSFERHIWYFPKESSQTLSWLWASLIQQILGKITLECELLSLHIAMGKSNSSVSEQHRNPCFSTSQGHHIISIKQTPHYHHTNAFIYAEKFSFSHLALFTSYHSLLDRIQHQLPPAHPLSSIACLPGLCTGWFGYFRNSFVRQNWYFAGKNIIYLEK